MDLIIKPTEACNFKCSFCSSTNITTDKTSVLDIEKIQNFLKRFPQTQTIIVNGGDPLMMSPDYYFEIIKILDNLAMSSTTISFTSNLWAFYKNPEKWTELFKNQRVRVCTSFNYGETRKITHSRIYTESDFWKVSDLFLDRIGYRPDFIAVINDDNESSAIKNVELAKKMNVVCKLNYAMASGSQKTPYLLAKIYQIYIEIYQLGLFPWEFNTQQMIKRIGKKATICPQNRDCDSGIRCLQPEGDYYSCGAFADDKDYAIDYLLEMNSNEIHRPLKKDFEIQFLKAECLDCPMFEICNGCKKTIKDLKNSNSVEKHCLLMKKNSISIEKLIDFDYSHLEILNFGKPKDYASL